MTYFTRTQKRVYAGPSFLGMIWLIVGVVVAAMHDYFVDVNTGKEIVSAIIAVVLWPLLLLGINLNVH
jgi:hypothetical protein